MTKSLYSLVVRGLKGKVVYANSYEVIWDKKAGHLIEDQVEGEAMIQMGKRLVKEGAYKARDRETGK